MSANVPPTQNGAPPCSWDAIRVSMVQNGTDTNTEHVTVAVIRGHTQRALAKTSRPRQDAVFKRLSSCQTARQPRPI